MKYLKTLALAAVPAAALVALAAGAASATVICANTGTAPEGTNPCTVGTHTKEYSGQIVAKTTEGAANQAKLVTNLGTVSCDSTTTVTPESSTGNPTITGTASVKFEPCTFSAGGTCTVTMSAPSYIAHTEGTVGGASSFKTVVTNPSATVVCGSFINCKFGKADLTLNGTNGEPTTVSASEVELNREGGFFCPSTSKWTVKYDVTAPSGGVTVGPASAPATVICADTGTTPGGTNPCNVATHTKEYSGQIPAKTTEGFANQAKLVTNLGTISCDSALTVTPVSSTGNPAITASFSMQLAPCTFSTGGACSVIMSSASYTGHLQGTLGGMTNSFELAVTNLRWTAVCGSFINCQFSKANLTLSGTNGEPTSLSAANVDLDRGPGICPSTAKWTVKYDVTSPSGGVTVH